MPEVTRTQYWRRLQTHEIERAFAKVVIDFKEILVLDGIDIFDTPPAFRIRCHDLHGPLPVPAIEDTGDRYPVLDRIIGEAAKAIAVARVRREIADLFPADAEFMLPTSTESGSVVGIRWESRIYLAEGPSLLEAYRELRQKVDDLD